MMITIANFVMILILQTVLLTIVLAIATLPPVIRQAGVIKDD